MDTNWEIQMNRLIAGGNVETMKQWLVNRGLTYTVLIRVCDENGVVTIAEGEAFEDAMCRAALAVFAVGGKGPRSALGLGDL